MKATPPRDNPSPTSPASSFKNQSIAATESGIPLKLAWRPRAQLDRESIAIFIGIERGAPKAALELIQHIDAVIERICLIPYSGGLLRRDSFTHKEYRTVLSGSYVVYYRFNNTTLTIYRILHQRQDIDTYSLVDLPD